MKRAFLFLCLFSLFALPVHAQSWRSIADNLIIEYSGKIRSIEQLNSSTCWAVLPVYTPYSKAVKMAVSIGYYIRNSTGGIRGKRPSIHVFIGARHIAVARPRGMQYIGKMAIANWDPSTFGGEYRP